MKKPFFYTLAILAVIIMIGLFGAITSKNTANYVYAYTSSYVPALPQNVLNPYIVNDFEGGHADGMPFAPLGMNLDSNNWRGDYKGPLAFPTPFVAQCDTGDGCWTTTSMRPGPVWGQYYGGVEWTGNGNYSPQYIHLTNYVAVNPGMYGRFFENLPCDGSTMVTEANPLSQTAGNWGCFGYLRLYTFLSFGSNDGTPGSTSQTVSLYDGSITITSYPINLELVSTAGTYFQVHVTMSLKYLANQYNIAAGKYFDIRNITDVIINAPQTDYACSCLPAPSVPAAFATPNAHSIFVNYDELILGDGASVLEYESPGNITVTTAFNPPTSPVSGAFIGWDNTIASSANYVTNVPVTGFHIYKSLSNTLGTGPYVSAGVVPANVTYYVDTQNYGGAVSCYKVLTLNYGPTLNMADQKLNTINATYNEPFLTETIVVERCGYVAPRPTFTSTQTPGPIGTPTMTGTPGYIATVAGTPPLTEAYVYPNPFNPNAITAGYGGTGLFHVGNVQIGTKIHIYAMDGSLVKDGVYNAGTGFTWDGKNKNGSKVVSGLYYLVLEDPQKKTAVFRVIVCYKCDPVYKP